MRILVCIKQVPDTAEIKIDPKENTLIRAGVPSIVNPFDEFALEMAAKIRASNGGTVTALSMGPLQAMSALRDCLAAGADEAYLLSDRHFGGSDTLATSYILSKALKMLEEEQGEPFDLILCGKQAIDGDTGQVGPEIAEHLGYTQVTYVAEARVEDRKLIAKREIEEGFEVIEASLPAVISVIKTPVELPFPSLQERFAAAEAEIPVFTLQDVTLNNKKIGLKGSPTKVKKTFTPRIEKKNFIIRERTAAESAKKLTGILREAGIV